MKTLYKADQNEEGALYAFEHNGISITNPIIDESGRFLVSPEHYGFKLTTTGGNCTAHYQPFDLDGRTVIMLITDGNLHHIDSDTITATVGVYDEHMDESISDTWEVTR